jgi:hypothetical protein
MIKPLLAAMLIATNIAFAIVFFVIALDALDAGFYAWCSAHIVMTAVNGGLATSALSKLWNLL